ncbi:MAG: ankyrin repeat domain-containing protein [Hydrococcus sp. Prado102]|nr:ankyrin repeat domain-containing protein [Hydrococcus sp. Prado102]
MDEQLLAAIEARDIKRVKVLLAAGANPNAKKNDKTAYQLAKYGPDEIKCFLIEAGAEDPSLRHLLVWAVGGGRVETVKALIQKGADVNMASVGLGSPLLEAARKGNPEIVDLLIAAGADVDDGNSISTPLLSAIEQGHFEIALKLIAVGANPTQTSRFGGVPAIAFAAAQGSPEVIQALIAGGADVNVCVERITINRAKIQQQTGAALKSTFDLLETIGKTFENASETIEAFDRAVNRAKLSNSNIAEPETALDTYPAILAARCGHPQALAVLLEAGAEPYRKDGEGLSAYDWAVKNEYSSTLDVLRRFGIEGTKVSVDEYLINAAEQGDVAAANKCLEKGARAIARDERRKTRNYTPLMLAASQGHAEVVLLFLYAGADIDASDIVDVDDKQPPALICDDYESLTAMGLFLGITPLMLAASKGHINVVRVLLDRQANLQLRDCFGRDAMSLACIKGHLEVVRALIQAGVSVNRQDVEGDTPLLMALSNQHKKLARFLIESGAEVNAQNNDGRTPLMAAAEHRSYIDIVQMLVERGADVNAVSQEGDTAMTVADLFDNHKAIELLARYGAQKRQWDEKDEEDEGENDDERWGAELAPPDFGKAAQNPEYRQAVADLGKICGSQPVAMYDDIPGWFQVHVNSKRRRDINTEALQQQFLARGCFVYEPDKYYDAEGPKKLNILPTTNKYDVIALHQTNGCNYGIGTGYIVQWLRSLEIEQPFILTLIANDTLEGRFLTSIAEPEKLAKRMYALCPDIVDQGCGSVDRLAQNLLAGDNLFFWWD